MMACGASAEEPDAASSAEGESSLLPHPAASSANTAIPAVSSRRVLSRGTAILRCSEDENSTAATVRLRHVTVLRPRTSTYGPSAPADLAHPEVGLTVAGQRRILTGFTENAAGALPDRQDTRSVAHGVPGQDSACWRSSSRSSGSSRPTDSRTTPSDRPIAARPSGPIARWVVVAGWVMSDLESPRLFEMSTMRSLFSSSKARFLPSPSGASSSNVMIVPPPLICDFASSYCGCDSRYGYLTQRTASCVSRNFAMRSAESTEARNRTGMVSRPLSSVHALNGLSDGAVWRMSCCTGPSM